MMRLQSGHNAGPSDRDRICSSREYGDATSLQNSARIILGKVEAARARHHSRVNGGRNAMSDSETRGSVIYGVCQHDPERWREFDAIYRPMLMAFLQSTYRAAAHLGNWDRDALECHMGEPCRPRPL